MFCIKQIKRHQNMVTNLLKYDKNLVTNLLIMTNSQATAELENCKIENTSRLFLPLVQYPGSDKRRVLSHGVTIIICVWLLMSNLI